MTRFSGARRGGARTARFLSQTLGVLALALLLTAGILEAWARLQPRRFFLVFDPTLGFKLQPGATGEYRGRWMLAANPHIRTRIRINSLGMRGPERTVAKPAGTRRSLILGDSFVQSFEVPWEESFYALLEQQAREDAHTQLETLPMGVNGYGQAQQLLWLEREGVALDADLVLLIVFLGNDITDNSSDLGAGSARPYFDLRDGKLIQVAFPSESARWKYLASEHLRAFILYREIAAHIDALKALASRMGWVNYPDAPLRTDPGLAERRRAAWDLTSALIAEIARVAKGAGSVFMLAFHGKFPTGGPESASERMLRICHDAGLDCLDLSAELEGRDEYFVPEDQHWTAEGHRRVMELLWARWRDVLVGGGPTDDLRLSEFEAAH